MEATLKKITERDSITFSAASAEDLSILENYGLPEPVVAFYKNWEPRIPRDPDLMMDIKTRLFSIQGIKGEIEELEPSCYLKEFGYIAFAASQFGNPFLFDLNVLNDGVPQIVMADHELSYMGEIPDQATANKNVSKVADSLEAFLNLVAEDKLN